ncbi:GLUG motif-containing protein [Desulfitibacter alkalitolerans]|uniref:GLUG motif-containing protein n=1 Tax=Desulfitibacter alkalitolerans TaxID=264641 RepID=UPI000688E8BC|nr:GLUG motif-containing protein [Desulfitibacter alkalitolerans]
MDLKIKKEWMLALVVLFCICVFVVSLPGEARELDEQANVSQRKMADISGHWANEVIKEWIEKDLITGYPDGTFKPNSSITRAEFMTLVNKAFGYKDEAQIEFSDVNDKAWFMGTVKKAAAAGYIGGYPDGTVRPNNPISRQEVAVVIAKIAGLSAEAESADLFTDALSIPGWSKGQIGAAAAAGYMGGYPDGSFRPANNITRAEAVMALNKTLAAMDIDEKVQRVFDKPGTYGPEVGKEVLEGDVWITVSGVKLQNMTIKGDLNITEGVGEGEVALKNIIVEGNTYIRGGGADSIYINGGEYNRIIIQKTKNGVRVIAIGTKGAAVIIEEETEDNEVILGGDFESVTVLAEGVTITTQGKTNIKKLTIQENAKHVSVTTSKDTTINEAVVNTNAEFDNQGRIIEATGKAARESIYDVNMPENLLSRRSSSSSGGGPTPPSPPQSEFAGGSGTEADPWLISTPEHLNNIRNYLSQEHADKYFKQTADISLENWGEWVPIGVDEGTQMFAGNYNGQGYIISNLFIDLPETNYVGLFGSIGEAKLENIILEGVDVTGRMLVGALVGYMNNSDIINCSSSGSIIGEFHTIGGLAGYSYHGTITNCFSEGTVTAGYGTVGGLVGRVYDGSIQSSYSTASVENEEHYDAGGLVGSLESDGVITESNSSGSVTGIFEVGGLAGRNIGGLIITCYSTGNVTGTSDVGGLVGRNYSTVQDSYATGNVVGENAGGLIGNNDSGTILRCYAEGNVDGTGGNGAGGLIGYSIGGSISESYAIGHVSNIGVNGINLGGLVGATNSSIYNCYAAGSVSGYGTLGGLAGTANGNIHYSYAAGNVSGSGNIGGLVGLADGPASRISNYYDSHTTGQSSSAVGTSKTTAEMIDAATFVGWNFNENNGIWAINHNPASYPYLKWQGVKNIPNPPSGFAGGFGTEDSPYLIETAEQLDNVRYYLGNDHLDKHFKQIEHIDLTDSPWNEDWIPIGNSANRFTGKYDGNNMKITGLIISDMEPAYELGLFGFTSKDAVLKNITLEEAEVSGNGEIGTLVGVNYGTVQNCSALLINVSGSRNIGGLIGINYGLVSNSHTTGTVTSDYYYAGGLIGENASYSGAQYLDEAGHVIDCYSSVNVTGVEVVGGLIGNDSRGHITGSYASGTVTGTGERVGGLIGDAYESIISECYTEGAVTGGSYDVGGLVGEATANTVINSCYASGSVSGGSYVGGLVGEFDGSISESHSTGLITGNYFVGGLVGYNGNASQISKSYALSDVSGTGTFQQFFGGLVGYNNGEINESYAYGDVICLYLSAGGLVGYNLQGIIQDSYARGDVQCPNRAGGLVGDNRSNIINSYSTGYVSGTDDVGGLVGLDDGGTVTNSFYDQITSGQNDIGNGTPKTTTEMKDQATFDAAGIDWDFESIWGINSGENNGYPFLRWQGYEHQLQPALLLGHWLFDEGTGTAANDSSGNGNHGTLEGAVWTADRFGNDGRALELGVDKWVNIPDTIKPSEITVCAWVYITATDGSAGPVFSAEKGLGGTGFGYRLQVTSDGKLRMEAIAPYTVTGARTVTSAAPLNFNQWYHVAGTYDGNNVKIFIDGVLEGSSSFDTYEGLNSDISIPLAIGHLEGWSVQWFRGKIDDARIYDSALTQEQILNIVTR